MSLCKGGNTLNHIADQRFEHFASFTRITKYTCSVPAENTDKLLYAANDLGQGIGLMKLGKLRNTIDKTLQKQFIMKREKMTAEKRKNSDNKKEKDMANGFV